MAPEPLTASSGLALTDRWHDQLLDISSLTYCQRRSCVTFRVLEENHALVHPIASLGSLGLYCVPLQWCCVEVDGAEALTRVIPEAETEAVINTVDASASVLRLSVLGGYVEIRGDQLLLNVSIVTYDEARHIRLSLGIADFTWTNKGVRRRCRRVGKTGHAVNDSR